MKTLTLAALALIVSAPASLAEPRRPARPHRAESGQTFADGQRAAVAIGRDGQDASWRCSTGNPNIEYRACVNASTRDPNAKVRMG